MSIQYPAPGFEPGVGTFKLPDHKVMTYVFAVQSHLPMTSSPKSLSSPFHPNLPTYLLLCQRTLNVLTYLFAFERH